MKSKLRLSTLFIVIALIGWQLLIHHDRANISNQYAIEGTTGGGHYQLAGAQVFAEAYKKTGLYPLNLEKMEMEFFDTYRMGDRGKMFLVWFDSFFTKMNWGYQRANKFFFIFSLLVFFFGFFKNSQTKNKIFAVLTTLFIGSSSFQLYEAYVNGNIFSWPISTTLLLMGLNAFAFKNAISKLSLKYYLLALGSGIALGLVKQIRTEPVTIGLSVVLLYLFMTHISIRARGLLVAFFISGFLLSNYSSTVYLDNLYKKTEAYVIQNGGEPYSGYKRNSHLIWHPIYCGFGDYAQSLGYRWDDFVAYSYALETLRKKEPNLWPDYKGNTKAKKDFSDFFIDTGTAYKAKLEDRDDYEPILKAKILSDMQSHPDIFITLYLKRIAHVFMHTSGVQLKFPYLINLNLNFPGFGLLFFPALYLATRKKDWFCVKLLLFPLPLLATALIIYSQNSYEFYSIFPTISLAILITYALNYLLRLRKPSPHNHDISSTI